MCPIPEPFGRLIDICAFSSAANVSAAGDQQRTAGSRKCICAKKQHQLSAGRATCLCNTRRPPSKEVSSSGRSISLFSRVTSRSMSHVCYSYLSTHVARSLFTCVRVWHKGKYTQINTYAPSVTTYICLSDYNCLTAAAILFLT